MKLNPWKFLISIVLSFAGMSVPATPGFAAPPNPGYHFLKEIPIGGEGGWGYLSVADKARRLSVTKDIKIAAVHLDSQEMGWEITTPPGVRGFSFVSKYGVCLSSNG